MFKKKKATARLMSILLVIAMMIGMFPMSASAIGYDFKKDYEDLEIRFWEDEEPDIGFYIDATSKYIIETVQEPIMSTTSGEWSVMDLLRGMYTGYDYINHIQDGYFDDYLVRIEDHIIKNKGRLDRNKSTEWSRQMLTLSSLGYDLTAVAEGREGAPEGGYDFLGTFSASHRFALRQGINGPIWEIIALNTGAHDLYDFEEVEKLDGARYHPGRVNENDINTVGKMIGNIIGREIYKGEENAGGWALMGNTPDPDITGMALQALAPYYLDELLYDKHKDENAPAYEDLQKAVERGIYTLSELQKDHGGYDSWGSDNVESIVQAIVALTALEIDPLSDNVTLPNIGKNCSFITGGAGRDGIQTNNMIDALLTFWAPATGKGSPEVGGFRHVTAGNDGGGGSGITVNSMATDQALYGLIAYDRFKKDEKSLYDMTDMTDGQYKTMMSEEALDSKANTVKFEIEGETISERKSPYAAIELPEGENLKDKIFRNWNTKADGTGTRYNAGEYLSMPKKDIVLYAQYRGEDEFLELKSIEPVSDLVINLGTSKEEVKDLLFQTTTVSDSDDEIYEVVLDWEIKDYDKDTLGDYEAVGSFELPEGVKNTDESLPLEVKANVKVSKEIPSPELEFDKEKNTITGYTGTDKDVIIPNEIGGRAVRGISDRAFSGKGLKAIFIPDTVTVIEEFAFQNNNLKEANIPDSITKIGNQAFALNELSKVKFPSGLRQIGNYAFKNNQLTEINIPETLQSIGREAFMNNKLVEVNIPKQIKSIEIETFANNKIEKLTLPNGLEDIKRGAFSKNKLVNIDIPDTVVSMGNNAFGGNVLTGVKLPNKLEKIEVNVFQDNKLSEIDIPENITSIENSAFAYNNITEGMARIDNHESKVEVGSSAFYNNGEKMNRVIKPIFLKDIKNELKITEVKLTKDGKSIAEGLIDESDLENRKITIQLPYDFLESEIDEIGLGSYDLVIKGTEGSSINQEGGSSGDWSEGKKNLISVDSPTKFTIEKYGLENEYRMEIVSPVRNINGIKEIGDVHVKLGTSKIGAIAKLPKTITLNLSGKAKKEVDVEWTSENYNGEELGEYGFIGNYELPEGLTGDEPEVNANVIVKEEVIITIENVNAIKNKSVEFGTSKTNALAKLPEKITLNLSNGITKEANVTWISEDYHGNEAGEYVFVGNYELPEEVTGDKVEVSVKVIVKAEVIIVENINVIENKNVEFGTSKTDALAKLPEKITLNLSNGIKKEVDVIWTSDAYDGDEAGQYVFLGSYDLPEEVTGEKSEVNANVRVKAEVELEIDKSGLKEKIIEAEELKEDNYTEESWTALEETLVSGKSVLLNEEATQDEVDKATQELGDAIRNLVEKPAEPEVDKSKLKTKINEAKELKEDNYTEETLTALKEVLDSAETLLLNDEVTQGEVDDALAVLEEAISNLKEKPVEPEVDKSKLKTKINEAKESKEDNYTEETWVSLKEALDSAETLLSNGKATQKEVDEAVELLSSAVKGLVEESKDSIKPVNPKEPQDPKVQQDDDNKPVTPQEKPRKPQKPSESGTSGLPKVGESSTIKFMFLGLILIVLGTKLWTRRKEEV